MIIRSACDVERHPKSKQLVSGGVMQGKNPAHLEAHKLSFYVLDVFAGRRVMC